LHFRISDSTNLRNWYFDVGNKFCDEDDELRIAEILFINIEIEMNIPVKGKYGMPMLGWLENYMKQDALMERVVKPESCPSCGGNLLLRSDSIYLDAIEEVVDGRLVYLKTVYFLKIVFHVMK
jgi:hypothetical protein